jgi:2-oxoglutarate dehydrogenase E2 component (dihydrolipoamide succinyltransferase)
MIDVLVPEEQEGTKAVVRAWLKQVGDRVEENDPLVELETDKVAMEIPAPAAGVLREILLHSNEDAVPGAILGRIAPAIEIGDVEAEPVRREVERRPAPAPEARPRPQPDREARLSPSVKRAVLQHDIDPGQIAGTGRGGRITRADVDRAVEEATRVRRPVEGVIPAATGDIRSHFVPHDNMRLRIAEHMQSSVAQAPHVTAVFEADFSAIIAHRDRHKAVWAKKGVKLSYTAYLVAAAAEAMKVAPAINSRWHADRLELYDDINIGIGTALGTRGLIVPVLRQVQKLSLKGIASGLDDLIERARARS